MDYLAISDWFKSTILGIILLGALGSIIAAGAIYILHRLLLPIFKMTLVRSIVTVLKHFAGSAAGQITEFVLRNGQDKIIVFYILQLMKLLLALFIATCSFLLFSLAVMRSEGHLTSMSVLTPVIISFLALWYGLRSVAVVALPVYFDIEKAISDAKSKVLTSRAIKE